jgi:hypothetical protein
MAVTFNDLVSRVKQQLLGYTKDQASISYLTQPMTSTDMTFQVDVETVKNLSRGLTEIEDEMLLVKKYDSTSGTVTVFGNALSGRGVESTTATSHASGVTVTADPRFPRQRIKEAINDTINGVYPDLFVIGSYEFPWRAARYEYPLPVEVEQIYGVTTNTIGPSAVWFPNSSYRFNPLASTTPGQVKPDPTPTGKTIQVMRDFIVPGRDVRVIYTKKPNELVNLTDDFATTTGLEERVVDMIVFGATWRLLPSYDAGRLQQQSIEATERAPLVPPGSAVNTSKYFYSLYKQRLDEERDRMLFLYPRYRHFNA